MIATKLVFARSGQFQWESAYRLLDGERVTLAEAAQALRDMRAGRCPAAARRARMVAEEAAFDAAERAFSARSVKAVSNG